MLGPEDVLVEKPAQSPVKAHEVPANLLSHNRPFDAVGRTSVISCEPAELHFRGIKQGEPVQQVVRLRNESARQTRVMVVPPTSSCFKVVGQVGGGSLAPWLCQQLTVEFTGQQLQHYQDNILVHTEDGGLVIPLHAYPCSGSPPLPKHLDIGHVPLGKTGTSQLQFTCRDGVTFDYSITVMQHNKHFTVGPLTGTMPAHGGTAVTVTFTPTKYSTEHLQLQVLLSEYSAEPMQVLVTGSCKPGLVQQKLLTSAFGGAQPLDSAHKWSCQQAQDQAAWTSTARSRSPTQRAAGSPSAVSEALNKTQHITQHDVNMLLNQRPGKLQAKDIQTAIIARKQELAVEQQQLQAALDAGAASGIDPLDSDIQPDIKEALFQLQLSQAEAAARRSTGFVSGKDSAHVGSTPPTAEELATLTAARAAVMAKVEAQTQQEAVHRLQFELKSSGAVHVLSDLQATASSSQQSGSGSSATNYPGLDSFQPQWLLLSESNDWRKRVQVAQRFVQAVRVVICRNRAQTRLRKLRSLAARLRSSKDSQVAEQVQDLAAEGTVVQRPGVAPIKLLTPDRVHPTELPQYCPQDCIQHEAVDKGLYADFSALEPQPFKAEFEYSLLMGYKAEELPSLLPYVPLCTSQPLLLGAAEDVPGGMQAGLLPQCLANLSSMDAMPDAALSNPYPTRQHSSTMQFALHQSAWGLEPQQMLRPSTYKHLDSSIELSGLCTVKALAGRSRG